MLLINNGAYRNEVDTSGFIAFEYGEYRKISTDFRICFPIK